MTFDYGKNAEFFARSSGFDFNGGDFSKFKNYWDNNVDANKKTQLGNFVTSQGGTADDINGLVDSITNKTPWGGANSTIGNPTATMALDKQVQALNPKPVTSNLGFGGASNGFAAQPSTGSAAPMTGTSQQPYSTSSAMTSKPMDTSQWTADDYQAVARMGGYTGPMGAGQHGAWLDADPTGQRRADYQKASQSYGQDAAGGGVMPVGVVSQLNDWQKNALNGLNAGAPDKGYETSAANALTAANLGLSNPTANISKFMNPYYDVMSGEINKQYDVLDNAARARAARLGNSGSSSETLRQTENNKNRVSTLGELLGGQWNNALNASQGNINSTMGMADAWKGLDSYSTGKYTDQMKTALGAGGVIQDQEQRMLDAVQKEIQRKRDYPQTQAEFLMKILGAFPTGSNNTTVQPGNAIGGALGGGLLGNYLSTSGLLGGGNTAKNYDPNATLPWL